MNANPTRSLHMKHKAGLYRWEFEKGEKPLSVAVSDPLVDDLDLLIRASTYGVCLAYMWEENGIVNAAN
jgi:hypothetical protein